MISKQLIAAGVFVAALLMAGMFFASYAMAADNGAETFTIHVNKAEAVFYDFAVCTDEEIAWEFTEVGNGAFHVTELPDGTFHAGGSFHASVTIRGIDTNLVEDADGNLVPENPNYGYIEGYPTYVGHYTVKDGDNANANSSTRVFTFNVRFVGSDGSVIQRHVDVHVSVSPDGVVHRHVKVRCN